MPGCHTIRALLIANRGEIAVRVARTASALGVRTIAVYAPADAGALHTRVCDEALPVDSYLDAPSLLAAARRARADAVHPGYGFLAENAGFAASVTEAGLVWVGPPPGAIAARGDKVAARRLMEELGVPVVPGCELDDAADDEALRTAAARVGYPVMVKASAGGGGKGMRVVADPGALPGAVAEARRLAKGAFGDDRVFLERVLSPARHVEVQVLADAHGAVTHLWERECSVQRRHQKVIEEAPSPAFSGDEARLRLCRDAIRAAAAVGYEGAGTVEFLLGPDGRHYFLEMNTRIQVEHPVTEAITGLDLVGWQLAVAEGRPLDPALLSGPSRRGNAIEARLYAEDPDNGYLPSVGRVAAWRAWSGARVDAGVGEGDEVGIHFDPMLAKVIAWGEDREAARRLLIAALERHVVLGPLTNRPWLLRVLDHPGFASGDLHTGFLDEAAAALRPTPDWEVLRDALWAAVALGWLERREGRSWLPGLAAGWRNNRWRDAELTLTVDGEVWTISYAERDGALVIDGTPVRVLERGPPRRLDIGGPVRDVCAGRVGDEVLVHHARAVTRVGVVPDLPLPAAATREAGGCVAPMPGKVVRCDAVAGARVSAGDPLVTLEAMKMEQTLVAPADGVVSDVRVSVGDQVDAGQVLVTLDAGGA